MKAIETHYKGYRFRSRLEARWAVFFDALGVKWEYEPEGYELDGVRYLPDFYLPQVRMYGEVKPEPFNRIDLDKARRLVTATRLPVLMLIGMPDFVNYTTIEYDPWAENLGPVLGWDYSLITRMIHRGERRFPCGNYLPDHQPECWPAEYAAAIVAARAARFEYGDSPRVYPYAKHTAV